MSRLAIMTEPHNSSTSGQGDALNLDRDTFRQLVYSHAGTRRLVREVLFVDAVHLREVVHGRQERRDLSYVNAGSEVNSMALRCKMKVSQKARLYLDNTADGAS